MSEWPPRLLPGEPVMVAMSPCFGCGRVFAFDPDSVPAIRIDPQTRKPPEGAEAQARSVAEPVCPSCARRANLQRAKLGLPLITERDTAADLGA